MTLQTSAAGGDDAPANTSGSVGNRTLKVKGRLMSAQQKALASEMLGTAKSCGASTFVMVALMVAAIYENTMSASSEGARIGPLSPMAGSARYGSAPSATAAQIANQVTDFCKGGGGGAFRSAMAVESQYASPVALAEYAEGAEGQYESETSVSVAVAADEARAIVAAYGGGALSSGGIAGEGSSTGTSNDTPSSSGYQMGSTDNPDQDFWTTINQLAQDRQWYLFSDGETIYLADGPDLLKQTPALTLDRIADAGRILSLSFTWDNTAFQYTVNRLKPSKHVVHKTALTKVQSPVQATIDVICDIDAVRAGDIVYLSGCGPGDGKWLVGDCTRSVFQVFSELTLVPPMAPLSEEQAAGGGSTKVGSAASIAGSGTAMAGMLQAATAISNAKYPYVWGGGHGTIGHPSGGPPPGYDCSGSVSAVLGAGGLLKTPQTSYSIVSALGKSVAPGQGHGNPECTIFTSPPGAEGHVFMRLNGQYFGTSIGDDGMGPGRLNGTTQGPSWYKKGTVAPDASTFIAHHVTRGLLGTQTSTGGTVGTGEYEAMYDTANADTSVIKQITPDPYAVAAYVDGDTRNVSNATSSFPDVSAAGHLLTITVLGSSSADCLDYETGNADPDCGQWVKSALANGVVRPCVYANMSTMPTVKGQLNAAGLSRQEYRLWVADYTGSSHLPDGYDACQWTDPSHGPTPGVNVDYSVVASNFFDTETEPTS